MSRRIKHSKPDVYDRIRKIIDSARARIAATVNFEMVQAYWLVGREMVEEEQRGSKRAKYGTSLIEEFSRRLTAEYGKGWSPSQLWHLRQFFLEFQDRCFKISHTACATSGFLHTLRAELSWSHYRLLMRVDDPRTRSFYEVECAKSHWSTRELERQIAALLYERLALSKDKKAVRHLAKKGQEIQKYEDLLKDPYVLEFTRLPAAAKLYESDLEEALINNLSQFLLELGRGFTFVARQKRLTLEGDHFFVDLVFYNTVLRCYLLIDLKVGKLTHQDLGQMQMYVHFYDREVKGARDNPTAGLILCSDKKDAVVRYTLPVGKRQIFASKYKLYLPTEEELREELKGVVR